MPSFDPTVAQPSSRRRRVGLLAAIAVVAFGIDLATKVWVVNALTDREPVRLAGGLLYLTLARNSGAAFSMGTNFTVIITIVMIAVVMAIVVIARKVFSTPWAWALGLILGGAGGNLADRLFRHPAPFKGAVVDFFSLLDPYGGFFAIFNVADICIVTGGILAALLAITGRELDGTRHVDNPKDVTSGAAPADDPQADDATSDAPVNGEQQ